MMPDRNPCTVRRFLLGLVLLALLPGVASTAALPVPRDSLTLQEQFALFLEWFPGRYDSALQTRTDALEMVPETERNYRRHSIFRRVALPAFGEVVFYAEQYRDGDPAMVYRQRIYALSLDQDKRAIRLRVHIPEDVEGLRGAYREPELLAGLKPGKTTVWAGCDLWWRLQGERFRGALEPGACRFTSEAFGQEVVLEEYLLLGSDDIQFADRGLALDGSYLFGMRGEVPNISLAVRPFLCELRQGGAVETRWLHDQGGQLETSAGVLALQRWNGADGGRWHDRGLLLTLSDGTGSEVASALAPTDAEAVSLAEGDFAADCRHAPDRLYDDGR